MTSTRSEFTVAGQHRYDRRGPVRWILSHQARNPWALTGFLAGSVIMVVLNSSVPGMVGQAFDAVQADTPETPDILTGIVVTLLVVVLARSAFDLVARLCTEVLAKRMELGARDELYLSLLGKSQTFHNRQRVGDLMARGANDVKQLGQMFSPGIDLIVDSLVQGIVPLFFIAFIDWRLLLAPGLFAVGFVIAVRHYMHRLAPVSVRMREQFGTLNSGLSETVRGIEVVKVTAQEAQEGRKFAKNARGYRDYFVEQGLIQAKYLPMLLLAVATAGALLHGLLLQSAGQITVGDLIAYLGLMGMLGFPTFISIFSFSLVQMGLASADRILSLMREETELDHNQDGHTGRIRGEIVFDNVTFGYEKEPVLRELSFRVEPGQTVAVVGETGSGKSTLTSLVNRIYDCDDGRILVDGVDVTEWNLDSLRSQVSTIEQDIVLFSRSITENIGFSLGQRVDTDQVVRAAKDAQADGFINELEDGYDTVIGERGVTLSGGQRQRLAIARALVTDPAILILDDSTSAVDSGTEDEIQRAIRRILQGRTTLLITHRLSQIRWADQVLLLRRGELVDQGTHDELLERCRLYQRIFAHYDEVPVAPPTVAETDASPADGSDGGFEAGRAVAGAAVADAAAGGPEAGMPGRELAPFTADGTGPDGRDPDEQPAGGDRTVPATTGEER